METFEKTMFVHVVCCHCECIRLKFRVDHRGDSLLRNFGQDHDQIIHICYQTQTGMVMVQFDFNIYDTEL